MGPKYAERLQRCCIVGKPGAWTSSSQMEELDYSATAEVRFPTPYRILSGP